MTKLHARSLPVRDSNPCFCDDARRQLAAASRAGDPAELASALWRAIPGLPLIVSRDAFVKFFMGQGPDAKNAVSGLASSAGPAQSEP